VSGRWPFVGRDRELARAEARLAAGVGTLAFGASGVGKSAFARELGRRAAAAGTTVSYVVGYAVSSGTPYEVFAGALSLRTERDAGELDVAEVSVRLGHALLPGPREPTDKRPLLVVDDIQLIDEPSAQALLRVATAGGAIVVATAPQGAALPLAGERLWRDGWCDRLDLGPLTEDDVATVLGELLDGPIEPITPRKFAQRCGGNALFLRELVTSALDGGSLARRASDDAWSLVGDPPLSHGIRELVATRLDELPDDERAALEVIAAGEPLRSPVADDLVGEVMLDRLAAHRLVSIAAGLAGPTVTTAHPLYGDVLRAEVPPLRLHRLRLAVARRLEADARPSPHDLVRAAVWRLDSGEADDADRLVVAARAAKPISLATAERLARHAYEASGSLPAALLLAEVLTNTGRAAQAAELVARLPPDSLAPADREALVYCAAVGQGLLAGDPGAAADLVGGVLAGDPAASDQLRALHGALLAFDAQFESAIEVARPIVDDRVAAPAARTLAALGVTGALYWLGRYRESVAIADIVHDIAAAARDTAPYGLPAIELIATCALAELGDLDAANQRALRLQRMAADEADAFAGPRANYCLGRLAMTRGDAAAARRLFAGCLAEHSPFDSFMERHLGAMLARAAVATGDVDAAEATLRDSARKVRMKTYDPEDDLAEAAVLAWSLRLDDAAEAAAWAAGVAASRAQWSTAVIGYHDAARYGAARHVVAQIREAAAYAEGEFIHCLVDHVVALAANDAAGLDAVADRFEAIGALLLAAEAKAEAALAHAAAGGTRSARASGGHAAAVWSRCSAAPAPWLTGARVGVSLTTRERQVAALAAAGLSDAAIAARLRISIRTVQTHLGHAYEKLGSAGRSDLAARLADRPAPNPQRSVVTGR
jgi:DNA-binding CsgD family transcriptional regulator